MRLRIILFVAAVLIAGNVGAASLEGVEFPDGITVEGTPLVLNGLGLREATVFKVNVYVAALYLEDRSSDGQAICQSPGAKRLILHFVRDVDRDDITNAWTEGFYKNSPESMESLLPRIEELNGWMTDMDSGDEMVYTYLPGTGIEVSIRGSILGVIEGDDFAPAFFSIWLGEEPPNGGLQEGLLGLR